MAGVHALLSASSASRWLKCTPSPRLEATLPDSKSEYADEGSLAHEIGELKLRKHFVEPMSPRTFSARLKKLQKNPLYKDEMLKNTDAYMDYVSSVVHSYANPPYIAIEKRLDYSIYAPEGFGTGDCVVIGADTLHVIDYKNGVGVAVSAVENAQMRLYALGALAAYGLLFDISKVKLSIVQPRIGPPSEWETTKDELLAWGESIKPIAQAAFKGEGEFVSGEHCKFCRAKATCRARAESCLSLADYKKALPPLLSNEEVGAILARANDLVSWAKQLKAYALSESIKNNGSIPGWKAVAGKSSRSYRNQLEAFTQLVTDGIAEDLLYVREPLTPPALEELLGKVQYKELVVDKGLVVSAPGAPTLTLESDKREAIKSESAKDVFSNIVDFESAKAVFGN
jgi:hypothetical protein